MGVATNGSVGGVAPSEAPSRPPQGPAPGKRPPGREALLLLVSALVVLAGTAAVRRGPEPAPPKAAQASILGLPPPLPSGAPMRDFEALPADDERSLGCHFAERGFGDYGGWRRLPIGRALVPAGRAVRGDGSFPLLVHFHGAEPVRRQLAPEGFDLVIAAVDAGVGSHAYERAFDDPGAFAGLVAAVEAEVAAANGLPSARAAPIALSSWSAGYGAIGRVLVRPHDRVEAVVLLDSLYAGYLAGRRALEHGQLGHFLAAARAAEAGGPVFYLAHTTIATPGYASTDEVASFLLGELGARASPVESGREAPNELYRMFEQGHLTIRGYRGADRDAHCAALHLLPGALREAVLPVWRR
jgi:hypothetical protein